MKLSDHQSKFAYDIGKLILRSFELGIHLTFGEAQRTVDQQYLYFKGKKIGNSGILEDAPKLSWTMNSMHIKKCAVDFNHFLVRADGTKELTYNVEDLKVLGEYWESLDELNQWGGFWKKPNGKLGKDVPHYQRTV